MRTRWTAATTFWSTVRRTGWSIESVAAMAAPTRAPSRDEYSSVRCWSKMKPNSSMPSSSSIITVTTIENSTRLWPRSPSVEAAGGTQVHHRIGSMRMTLDRSKEKPGPVPTKVWSGVT